MFGEVFAFFTAIIERISFTFNVIAMCIVSFFMLSFFHIPLVYARSEAFNITVGLNVREAPCFLVPGSETLSVSFGSIERYQLDTSGQTEPVAFTFKVDCDGSPSNNVIVSLKGVADQSDPKLLALSDGSDADGIAIGLLGPDGAPMSLNEALDPIEVEVEMEFNFSAFVQRLSSRQIQPGDFSAMATLDMVFE